AAASGGAAMFSAGLVPTGARTSAEKAVQTLLPTATEDVTPFEVHVSQAALDDLKKRLANARWPDKEPVTDWSQGVPLAKAQALVEYWRTRYDWRRVESSLNRPLPSRVRVFGQTLRTRVAPSAHRGCLGGSNAASGLQPLRRARWR